MLPMIKGRYRARLAETAADIRAAQSLRHLAFYRTAGCDADRFDDICNHVLIEDHRTDAPVACFRFMAFRSGADIGASYAAQYYDLAALSHFTGRMVELGRFCVHPDRKDPDILRLAWGAMTRYVDARSVEMLFGCASFPGLEAAPFTDAFALLRDRHQGPARWMPGAKAGRIVRFAEGLPSLPDKKTALRHMPPLLRTYLMMGGWVSDHAVIDPEMNTLHVFTGVEIHAIPATRKRLLREVAGTALTH